ncbi:MAG TPA: hypothetical protein VNS33_18560, partial [Bradyrhizobium sp.]|nr:hypothetical protein [Bradyrhizobium sp.]
PWARLIRGHLDLRRVRGVEQREYSVLFNHTYVVSLTLRPKKHHDIGTVGEPSDHQDESSNAAVRHGQLQRLLCVWN